MYMYKNLRIFSVFRIILYCLHHGKLATEPVMSSHIKIIATLRLFSNINGDLCSVKEWISTNFMLCLAQQILRHDIMRKYNYAFRSRHRWAPCD